MKHNPDDRRDNVANIQNNIDHTIENMQITEDMMKLTDDPKLRKAMKNKNDRRENALDSMRNEIQDEARDKQDHRK